jgi:hypothetical protein
MDREIRELLIELGFRSDAEQSLARAALEAAKLTNPRKSRIRTDKIARARALLQERFVFACVQCAPSVRPAFPQAALVTVSDDRCSSCGGSANVAAAARFLVACQRRDIRKVVVVGGSPRTRQEVLRLLPGIEFVLIDGTAGMNANRARHHAGWADLVLVWGSTQLDHRVSRHFTSTRPNADVVVAAKRGVAGLLDAGTLHLARG